MKNWFLILAAFVFGAMCCGCGDPIRAKLEEASKRMEAGSAELGNVINAYYADNSVWPKTLDDLATFAEGKNLSFQKNLYSSMTFTTDENGALNLTYTTTDGGSGGMVQDKPFKR